MKYTGIINRDISAMVARTGHFDRIVISDAGFPFSYKLNRNADNSMALDRGKFKMSFADAFASLYTRVKGK